MKMMKSIFKTLSILSITLSGSLFARDIIVITYNKGETDITKVKKTIESEFQIPGKLFTFKEVDGDPCKKISKESILHLCLKKNDVHTLHSNNDVLINSFSTFTNGEG